MSNSLFTTTIHGIPSSYSTTKEKPWKEALNAGIPVCETSALQANGVIANFHVVGPQTGNLAVDLDNLCEPLFSVVVNKKGWFGGKRSNIQWFKVTKSYYGDPGCDVNILLASSISEPVNEESILLSGHYKDTLPNNSNDPMFVTWVNERAVPKFKPERFLIELRFGNAKLNIGDIGTGRVKNIIDCMYPILGGSAGAPEDWRVYELIVVKNDPDIPAGTVYIRVGASDFV